MADSIAIVSGGIDSVTLLHYLVKEKKKSPAVLTYLYGQKHSKEIECAKQQVNLLGLQEHRIVDLSLFSSAFAQSSLVSDAIQIPDIDAVKGDPQPSTYVPNRNMIFLSIAAAFAETLRAGEIYYGAQAHDLYGYWDTTPDFLARINAVLSLNRKSQISIQAPFVNMPKAEVLRLGLSLGVDYGKTWSCYKGDEKACGECPTCAERLAAFEEVGRKDTVTYQ